MGAQAYSIKPGDTLSAIAHRHLGRASLWPQIFAYNAVRRRGRPPGLKDPNKLRVGQRIFLPPRVSEHPPHLRNHLVYRHPAQVTRPAVSTNTQPATQANVLQNSVMTKSPAFPAMPKQSGGTHVNSFAFKYNLDLLPTIREETPEFEFEAKFTGQIYIWADKQIDILTLTKTGAELQAKSHADTALGQLVNSGKVTWDGKSNRVTYENLMTTNAVGAPPNMTAVGVVMDSSNPMPAIRVKFTSPRLAGRLPPTMLYLAEAIQITLDIRMKPKKPPGPDAVANGNFATIAPPVHNLTTAAPAQSRPSAVAVTATGSSRAWWDRPSILLPGAAILLLAVAASNVVTWGADAEVDPAAVGAADAMITRGLAARVAARGFAAPVLAH
ncbi:LysM peptidoglycan-binding domain-containing protein [Acidisoma cellulosilytica]|uniref:LysM peptidoglycan-binding domain-containing protein n=1 Tax=Acidisoma cellulosilyticum TaxID=2802395 RepID=A0A964E4J3_9PROT|nr:LysM peptidoglycan-binding domain-containing protein [Acidisoma cellulosilyticum]MCB8881028.1 LysM peptidoglycan-binding domain-containing protein [Acidisoma cellulosilyticum]